MRQSFRVSFLFKSAADLVSLLLGIRGRDKKYFEDDVYLQMKTVLQGIDFDFAGFTMDRFTAWVQERHGREIRFIPWHMPPGLFGVWMSDADEPVEHIFIDKAIPPLHQVHTQLHELSHMLCKHATARLTRTQMVELLHQAIQDPSVLKELLLRSPDNDQREREAETLAALIQNQVIGHQRIQQLSITASSNKELLVHFEAMELV